LSNLISSSEGFLGYLLNFAHSSKSPLDKNENNKPLENKIELNTQKHIRQSNTE
jgi:hypothetical protein